MSEQHLQVITGALLYFIAMFLFFWAQELVSLIKGKWKSRKIDKQENNTTSPRASSYACRKLLKRSKENDND